jgi:hypothetical protein
MKQVPDRKRLRREYLKRKMSAYTMITVGGTVFVPSLIAAFLFAAMTVVICGFAFKDLRPLELVGALFCGVVTVFFTWLTYKSHHAMYRGRIEARLPYVPPVTPDILTAEEILVRGSDAPPAMQSDVLLRAATEHESPKDELLRMSQGEPRQ